MDVIWRYFDYEKFEQLLKQKSLFFCSTKLFNDPFEGEFAWGKKGYDNFIETQKKLCSTHGAGMDLDMFMAFNIKTLKEISEKTYISCWHHNAHESEAMWQLYCKTPQTGLVIKTTKKKLGKLLEKKQLPKLQLKDVKYAPNFWIKKYNPEPDIFFTKRPAFEHEKEFRAFFQEDAIDTNPFQKENGKLIPVELAELIEEIRISPYAPKTFMDNIKSLLLKENLNIKVVSSEIEMHPLLAVEENIINTGSNWYQSSIKLVRKNV